MEKHFFKRILTIIITFAVVFFTRFSFYRNRTWKCGIRYTIQYDLYYIVYDIFSCFRAYFGFNNFV